MARSRANIINREELNLLFPPHHPDRYAIVETCLGRRDPSKRPRIATVVAEYLGNEYILNFTDRLNQFRNTHAGSESNDPTDFGVYQWRLYVYRMLRHIYVNNNDIAWSGIIALCSNGANAFAGYRIIYPPSHYSQINHLAGENFINGTHLIDKRAADLVIKAFYPHNPEMLADYRLLDLAGWDLSGTPHPNAAPAETEEHPF
jgi:hypothetical protein